MRLTAWMRVESISDGPVPVDVVLRAEANQVFTHNPGTPYEHQSYELVWYDPAEGAAAAELTLTLNYEPTFSVGDRVLMEFAPPLHVSPGGP